MIKNKGILWVIVLVTVSLSTGFAMDAKQKSYFEGDVLINTEFSSFKLITYSSTGGGASINTGKLLPLLEISSGFQLAPWLAIGGFLSGSPLSNFKDAYLGLSFANTQGAYSYMSGTEIILTPLANKIIHPLIRVAIGGISLGYLENTNGQEGYNSNVENRYFFSSISAGAEINISKHFKLGLRGGWRYAGNSEYLGIDKGGLSGFEASLTIRTLWSTIFE